MATEIVKTVKPSGGHYTNLSAFEAGEQRNLVAADEIAVAECYAMQDTTAVTISGWTTDATRYIKIYTPSSERHDGKWNAAKYRLEVAGKPIYILADHVRIDGLQIYGTDTYALMDIRDGGGTSEHRVYNCIVKGDRTNAAYGMLTSSGVDVFRAWNNVVYDVAVNAANAGIGTAAVNAYLYNNSVLDTVAGYGYRVTSGTCVAINNLSDSAGQDFAGSYDAASDYNASGDTSAPGTNSRKSQTFTFIDRANDDYHLASGDAGAKDYGMTNPGSGLYLDDIDGETRSGSWDIGADEYVAGGGISIAIQEGKAGVIVR